MEWWKDPARILPGSCQGGWGGEGRRDSSESQCFSPASAQIPRKIPITRAANPVRIGARKSSGWSGPSHRSRRSGRDESDQAANRSDNCPFTFKDPGRSPKDRRRNTPVRGRVKETARIPPINWQFSTGDPNPRNYKTQTRGKHNNNPARIGRGSGAEAGRINPSHFLVGVQSDLTRRQVAHSAQDQMGGNTKETGPKESRQDPGGKLLATARPVSNRRS